MDSADKKEGQGNVCVIDDCPLASILMKNPEEKEGFWDGLLKVGAVIGGGYLAIELFKFFAKKEYHCPNCKFIVKENASECPNCRQQLWWKQ